ncbi:hypothetical protein L596_014473 [Steinernema carpocapsae]|uniref:Uncharacterized protein n=1 Tax=Steinernema carpocapsae TaxID=34508 RepID=A0A4U5NCY3_STECR|nr:hypothetical protein L596_014473 [Steinernema carpocapsae]
MPPILNATSVSEFSKSLKSSRSDTLGASSSGSSSNCKVVNRSSCCYCLHLFYCYCYCVPFLCIRSPRVPKRP